MPALPVAARASLHHWEEPCLSGTNGAGTVFFSGCTLNCVFCQNEEISHKNYGKPLSPHRLREIFMELAAQGAHNIDLVNPTHFAHVVKESLLCLKRYGLVVQLVRTPPCHGGGRGFESHPGRQVCLCSSVGRAGD